MLMRMVALVMVCLIFSLVMSETVSSKKLGQSSAAISNYRYNEPLHGASAGNIVARACGNCHSDQTNWPWYSHVAPLSWWIENHVREGRAELNFSQWTTYSTRRKRDELDSICGVISNGKMPPTAYTVIHPEARLATRDKEAVCLWTKREIERERLASP